MGGYFQTTKTDAGWNYNVGKSAWNIDVLAYKEIAQLPTPIQDKFISDMAQNRHFRDRYIEWAKYLMNTGYTNVAKEELTLTWLTPKIINKIKNDGFDLNSPIVVMQNTQIEHSYNDKTPKQKLTESEYLQIYDIVNNPDEILYDFTKYNKHSKALGLAFIRFISNSEKCIRVSARLNEPSNTKGRIMPVVRITTVAKIKYASMGKFFKKIE